MKRMLDDSAVLARNRWIAIDPVEREEISAWVPAVQQPADEITSPVLLPRTFRVPQQLIEDLARAGELRALSWLDREGNTWLPISAEFTGVIREWRED